MTDMNAFHYTDNVHDVLAVYVNRLMDSTLRSEYKNIETLTADRELTDADTPLQRFDCGDADRVVTAPVEDVVNNHLFLLINASAAARTLTFKNNAGTVTLAVLAQGEKCLAMADGNGEYCVISIEGTGGGDGWIAGTGTWSYTSADDPIFVASVPDADAALINIGARIKLTQTTDKYFIVHAKGSPSGGFTPVTIYGGTDYDLANAAITYPYWSPSKSPLGFPMSPTKWTVTVTDTSNRSQASPVQNTWYNLGSVSISVPIGAWRASYFVIAEGVPTASGIVGILTTLSTANNSQSDAILTRKSQIAPVTQLQISHILQNTNIAVASKTTYYLNTMCDQATAMTSIANRGDKGATIITFECAYL